MELNSEQNAQRQASPQPRCLEEDRRKVLGWALRLTGNLQDAEDLTQDVMVRSITRGATVDHRAYDAWLYRVTRNLFVDGYRRRQRVRFEAIPEDADHLLLDERTPESQFVDGLLEPSVAEALMTMSEEYRTALLLRHVYDLTYEEIATRTDVPAGTVRSRIHRGRRHLRADVAASQTYGLAA